MKTGLLKMKKRILFVAENMNMNGANKSLINLLSVIDSKQYDVDLFLYAHIGPLMKLIPEYVTVLPEIPEVRSYEDELKTVLRNGSLSARIIRLYAAILRKINSDKVSQVKEWVWKKVSPLPVQYNLAVGYCEGSTHSFILKKAQAEKKAGWIHIKLDDINGNSGWQLNLCEKLDYVIAVSEDSKHSFIDAGIRQESVKVIYNIMAPNQIRKLARETPDILFDEKVKNILTVARLSQQKGIDLIIRTAKYLLDNGINFRWYIIGDLANCAQYQRMSEEYAVDKQIVFMGATVNPYCYIQKCDVYVQPSRFEGWGMALTEAKILGKPIVASDIEVFREQITDGKNGLIRALDEVELGKAIALLLDDVELLHHIQNNLMVESLGNVEEVEKFYGLIDE